jgi:hypothetical protein
LFGLVVLIAVIYKLLNHKDKTPEVDPLDKLEAEAKANLAEAEQAVAAKMDEVLHVAETATETPKATTKPENMSDAEWAMSDQNPNRVEVAPVVVTVDSPSAVVMPVAEVAPVAVKKPRAKKAAAPKAPKKTK